jgi:hypothetical protein
MNDDSTLLPPVTEIHERLSRNARERHRLRTLLRLARAAAAEHSQPQQDSRQPTTVDREVDHA